MSDLLILALSFAVLNLSKLDNPLQLLAVIGLLWVFVGAFSRSIGDLEKRKEGGE